MSIVNCFFLSWQARQRAGRAGREGPGHCYRLFTEESFEGKWQCRHNIPNSMSTCCLTALPDATVPEIQRCPLASVVLQLLALGVTDILGFDFMASPPDEALVRALEQLCLLGAVEEGKRLTPLGKQMAHLPLEPHLARAILSSPVNQPLQTLFHCVLVTTSSPPLPPSLQQDHGCSEEVLSIVALLSVDSVLYTPAAEQREKALAAREKFTSPEGDHIMLLNVYHGYKGARGSKVQHSSMTTLVCETKAFPLLRHGVVRTFSISAT